MRRNDVSTLWVMWGPEDNDQVDTFYGVDRWNQAYEHYMPEQYNSLDRLVYDGDIKIVLKGYFESIEGYYEDSEEPSICDFCNKPMFTDMGEGECDCSHCPECGVFNCPQNCAHGCQSCGTKYDFGTGERL